MRLFAALLPAPELRETLLRAQEELRRQGARGGFTREENLHLTLAFLGETENGAAARAALETLGGGPFELALTGAGRFNDLWWAGVEESPRLTALAAQTRDALLSRGFALERRPFRPHITLVRELRCSRPPVLEVPRTAMIVERVSLMRSERIGGKLTYTEEFARKL
jgi:2''-5'' RNA ligase